MSGRRTTPKILLTLAIITLVVSIIGFIGSILLNAFAFDKYNVYGEVPIPGQASFHLPAGEVNISFHARDRRIRRAAVDCRFPEPGAEHRPTAGRSSAAA